MMNSKDKVPAQVDLPRLQHAIMLQLCEVSFGPDLYTSPQIVSALERAIPMFVSMLNTMPAEKRHMKYALEIARQLGVDVRRMERSDERRMCFEAALVLVLSYFPEGFAVKYANASDLVANYPEFAEVEPPELLKLLNFRNMLSVALLLLPANHNRSHLLDVVTRLTEGRNVKYVTGSGAAIGTRRRVLIYQREGGVTPLARPPRREPADRTDNPPKKRVRNNSLVVASISQAEHKPLITSTLSPAPPTSIASAAKITSSVSSSRQAPIDMPASSQHRSGAAPSFMMPANPMVGQLPMGFSPHETLAQNPYNLPHSQYFAGNNGFPPQQMHHAAIQAQQRYQPQQYLFQQPPQYSGEPFHLNQHIFHAQQPPNISHYNCMMPQEYSCLNSLPLIQQQQLMHYQQFGSSPAPLFHVPFLPQASYLHALPSVAEPSNDSEFQVSFTQWLRDIWETSISSDQQGWAATQLLEDEDKDMDNKKEICSKRRTRDAYVNALELFLQLFLQVERCDVSQEVNCSKNSNNASSAASSPAPPDIPMPTLSVMELLGLFHAGALKDENPLRAEHLRSLGLFFCIKRCEADGLMDCYGENVTAEYMFAVQNYFMLQSKVSDRQQVPWQTFTCLQTAYARVMELYFRIISAVKMGLIKFRRSSWTELRDTLYLDYYKQQQKPQQLKQEQEEIFHSVPTSSGIYALLASAESLDDALIMVQGTNDLRESNVIPTTAAVFSGDNAQDFSVPDASVSQCLPAKDIDINSLVKEEAISCNERRAETNELNERYKLWTDKKVA